MYLFWNGHAEFTGVDRGVRPIRVAHTNQPSNVRSAILEAMVVSSAVLIVIVVVGFGLTTWFAPRLRFEERVAVGAVVGVVTVAVVTFLMFEIVGMGWIALGTGLATPSVAAVGGIYRRRARLSGEARWAWRRMRCPARRSCSLRPFAVASAASLAVTTRILSLAYQTTPTGLSAGSLATWADWSAHLAYAGSFAYGDNRGLDLPIATGTGFRYHFLVDFFGAVFTVSRATLPQSMTLSVWVLAAALPVLLWCAVERLTASRLTALFSLLLFVLSGGIGAFYFVRDLSHRRRGILTSLPQTYARIPDQHLWVDNTISASLYAQRSTLLGWSVGLAVLVLLLASRPAWRRSGFVASGVLLGVLGLGHAHMLLTGLTLGALALFADRKRTWWWFLVPAGLIGLPLAWAISPTKSSIRWLVGWMAGDSGQPWAWFWFRNVGLLLPLFAVLALLGGGLPRLRRLSLPLWLWFIVPNVIAFHPAEWNNTKYFLFWQFAGCIVVASWLSRAFRRSAVVARGRAVTTSLRLGASACVLAMISAGGLDTVRAMQRSTAIPWVDSADLDAAAWLRTHSETDAVLVYGATNYSAVMSLGGRRVVSGYTGWTYDLGLPDWAQRWSDSRLILQGADGVDAAVAKYGVDFVVIGPPERREFQASDAYWATHGDQVFAEGDYRIYRMRQ